MTFLDGAFRVLQQYGCYMDIKDIIEEVEKAGLYRSQAKPENKVNSLYGTLIKAVQAGDSRFVRCGNGPYFRAR